MWAKLVVSCVISYVVSFNFIGKLKCLLKSIICRISVVIQAQDLRRFSWVWISVAAANSFWVYILYSLNFVYYRKKLWTLCSRSDLSNLVLVVLFPQRKTLPDLSNGRVSSKFRGREEFWSNVWRFLRLSINSLRPLTRIWVIFFVCRELR